MTQLRHIKRTVTTVDEYEPIDAMGEQPVPIGGTPTPSPTPTPTPTPTPIPPEPEPVDLPSVTAAPAAALEWTVPRNGAAWYGPSSGPSGWASGSSLQTWIDIGIKAIRYPIKRSLCYTAEGVLSDWVVNHLVTMANICIAKNVALVVDDHSYNAYTDETIGDFWAELLPRVEAGIGGFNPLFAAELQNEPGGDAENWDTWAPALQATIQKIRDAGAQSYLFASWGDWNNARQGPRAMEEITKIGGMSALDPLGRTIFTMHDYWSWSDDYSKRNNDRSPYVHGGISIEGRYKPALDAARSIGAKIVMSEIGGGLTPTGPMQPFAGTGTKNGRQLQEEYLAFADANKDALVGTWFWSAGRFKDTYQHKVGIDNEHGMMLRHWWNSQ